MKNQPTARMFVIALVFSILLSFTGATSLAEAGPQSGRYRIGATCNDGSASSATGSGACSHHGGVRCWQYSDGTCTKP